MAGPDHGETELATAFRDGDDRACALLFERYRRPVYLFGLKMLGDADGARDMVQDVFLRIWERRGQLHEPGSFRSWLFAVARNRCLSRLRRECGQVELDEAPAAALAVAPAPDAREREQELAHLQRALAALSVDHREVLVLREYQELSYREIAEVLGVNESTVKSRLFKARLALHGAFAQTSREGG